MMSEMNKCVMLKQKEYYEFELKKHKLFGNSKAQLVFESKLQTLVQEIKKA